MRSVHERPVLPRTAIRLRTRAPGSLTKWPRFLGRCSASRDNKFVALLFECVVCRLRVPWDLYEVRDDRSNRSVYRVYEFVEFAFLGGGRSTRRYTPVGPLAGLSQKIHYVNYFHTFLHVVSTANANREDLIPTQQNTPPFRPKHRGWFPECNELR